MRYFGNFNLELRYCGILQTCGMRFLYVLVDDIRYKNVSFTFFRPFIAVFGRFGSTLKRPYFVTYFNIQFDCFNNPFKAVPLFPRSHRSFLPLFLLSRQGIHQLYRLTIKLRYFPIYFAVLRYLSNFFAVMRCSATPNVPLLHCVVRRYSMRLVPPFSQTRRNEFVSERGQKLAMVVMFKVCWRPISVGGYGDNLPRENCENLDMLESHLVHF